MEKSTHTAEYALLRAELRKLRENAGLTQRGLAARLRVPHSWVAKVESGERRIDVVELCWMLAACGVEPVSEIERIARQLGALRTRRAPRRGRSA